jgi:ribose transport system ATP-binding protein
LVERAAVTPLLAMRGVHKRFGAVRALAGVDLVVAAGEVHALVGENGAGKSTLMKVLSGALAPDQGEVLIDGRPFRPRGPLAARQHGIAMIYQELSLAPELTVQENVMLGREEQRFGLLRKGRMKELVESALEVLHHPEIEPGRLVSSLGPGERQLVELARALAGEARIVVMDEPTSSLSYQDSKRLFEVIARLRERGVAVIYISHFLEEVEQVADRYTVLRDGTTVATGVVEAHSRPEIIEAMVGRRIEEVFPRIPHTRGEPLLTIDGLAGERLPRNASLTLHRGEILGIAGLVGAGRTELLRALFGLDGVRRGEIRIAGAGDSGRPPWVRLAQGVGLLSEKRHDEGLAMNLSVIDNLTLSRLEPCVRRGLIDRRRQRALTEVWVDALAIRCPEPSRPVSVLSGGNQQKVALGRLLHHDVDVLLLDEPTRGVDVGSKTEIYRLIGELAASGKAILLVSSYLPELLGVCDRLAVMHRGILGPALAAGDWSETSVMRAATQGAAHG